MTDPYLSERMNRIDSSRIRRAFDLARHLKDPINLSIGQPHYPTPPEITAAIEQALKDGKTAYTATTGILPLRERLSKKFLEVNGFQANPDHILVSSGVAALLQLLFLASIDPGDRVLVIDPAFLIYRSMLSFYNAKREDLREDFTAEDVSKINPRGLKMILFSSPSNPSGRVLSREQIELLANLAEKSGALLVSDEIYELFDYENKFVSAASIYPEAVTLMGFSKSYSMTGLRLAAATGPEALIQSMSTIQQYTVVCAPAPVQWGGIQALDTDMSPYVEDYKNKRRKVLQDLAEDYTLNQADGAFYIFPELKTRIDDEEFVEKAIQQESLLLVPGNIFTDSNRYLRISYATTDETLTRGIDALKRLAKEFS